MDDDHTLLRRFAGSGDEDAFTELVRRHLGMVHGICLRRTGNRQLAEELVQNVFASLARKADSLKPGVLIVGWLHRSARFESLSALRSESSRLRNMKSYMDSPTHDDGETGSFNEISPFLDEALDALPTSDRDVVLLRFASGLTLQQIGDVLGKSESAAQRHLQRVLEKLATLLRRRGVTTSAAGIALFLGADFAKAAPVSLTVASVSKAAIASAATTSGVSLVKIITLFYIMKNKTIIIASVCLLAAGGSVAYVTMKPPSEVVATKGQAAGSIAADPKEVAATSTGGTTENAASRRQRPAGDYPELEGRFGASRVRLAKSATENLIKVTGSLVEMLEFQESHKADPMVSLNGGPNGDPLTGVVPGLTLSEEQKAKVRVLQAERTVAKLEDLKKAHANLQKNRTEVMELLLAGDATKSGKMSAADYQALLAGRKDSVLSNFGGSSNLNAMDKSLVEDEGFRNGLPSILDADQLAIFEEFRSQQAAGAEAGSGIPGEVPASIPQSIDLTSGISAENGESLEVVDKKLRKTSAVLDGVLNIMNSLGAE
jgi:RNA polymerase sigma factor (sigma-70 family)